MVIIALMVFGFIAYTRLPVLMFPNIEFPVVTVTTVLPGADPATVESKVTEVLEDAVGVLEGIDTLKSISMESVSQVIVQFDMEMDLDIVTQDVRDKIATAVPELPSNAEAPLVQKFDLRAMPILQIAISGNMNTKDLTEFVDKRIKNNIERIRGVGNVQIVGGRERQIRVWLDADKLRGYGLTADDVVMTLQMGNIDFPGGSIKSEDQETVLKTQGEVEDVSDFAGLIVSSSKGRPITVGDVAYVEDGEEDAKSFSRLDGEQAVSLLVTKRPDANELELADAVKEELAELQERYKDRIDIIVAQDNSTWTRDSVNDIKTTVLWGGLFAILVILLFFRNISATLIAAVSIPVSIISSFTIMSMFGFTMNMMTMMGLALSVGVLIDDSIVVIENIFRHREEGEKRYAAAVNATTEIGLAVMAATFTIVAVFVPVAFMKGMVGQFFYEFGITVAGAVLISLFVSFWLVPMLSSRFLRRKQKETAFDRRFEATFDKVNVYYKNLLDWSLDHRKTVIFTAIGLMVAIQILLGMGLLKSEFQPAMERDEFMLNIETPVGSTVEQTDAKVREIESLLQDNMPGVKSLFTTVGSSTSGQDEPNKAAILVKLVPSHERELGVKESMAAARDVVKSVEDVITSTGEASTMSGGGWSNKMLQFSLTGSDLGVIEEKAGIVYSQLQEIKGFVDLDTSLRSGKPEIDLHINRQKAADMGVNVFSIASTVNTLVGGKEVTTFQEGGEQYEVWVRLKQSDRDEAKDLEKIMVRSSNGKLIDIANVIDYERLEGPSQINRLDRRREVEITANLQGLPLGNAVAKVQELVNKAKGDADIELIWGGEAEAMMESFGELLFTLILAIFIIYMVLASQFDSFVHPLTIMISLPLSIIGAFLLLLITGKTLNIMSIIGVIMLMGIVTKNSILLIDLTNELRKDGLGRDDAIKKAGPIRLRPILMTAFSTILGVLPVALEIGEGAEMRSPMAIAVIGGLLTSTFLTLIVIPVVYTLLDDMSQWRFFQYWTKFVRSDD